MPSTGIEAKFMREVGTSINGSSGNVFTAAKKAWCRYWIGVLA